MVLHCIVGELVFIDEVNGCVYEVWVHVAGVLREAGYAIAALLRSAELELEDGLVAGVDNGEVVGHYRLLNLKGDQSSRASSELGVVGYMLGLAEEV